LDIDGKKKGGCVNFYEHDVDKIAKDLESKTQINHREAQSKEGESVEVKAQWSALSMYNKTGKTNKSDSGAHEKVKKKHDGEEFFPLLAMYNHEVEMPRHEMPAEYVPTESRKAKCGPT